MRYFFLVFAGLLSFHTTCVGQTPIQNNGVGSVSEKFQVGQVWRYHNRPGEDSSAFTILKIEHTKNKETIIHVRAEGLRLSDSKETNDYSEAIAHMPFSEDAISKSVTSLIGQINDLPDFSEGYNLWKAAYKKGKAGYFTIELKDAIEGIAKTMNQK